MVKLDQVAKMLKVARDGKIKTIIARTTSLTVSTAVYGHFPIVLSARVKSYLHLIECNLMKSLTKYMQFDTIFATIVIG